MKTPVQELIQKNKDRIQELRKNWAYYSPRISELELQNTELEKMLEDEREFVINFVEDYRQEISGDSLSKSARTYFNQKYGNNGN